ncbi:MAG: hypothetical protein AAF442_06240 [Pseudomonadota bacterium]
MGGSFIYKALPLALGASQQNQAIRAQEQQARLQASQRQLTLAQRKQEQQRKLRESLATQNNRYAAMGVSRRSGSAHRLARATQSDSHRALGLLTQKGENEDTRHRLTLQGLKHKRHSLYRKSMFDLLKRER